MPPPRETIASGTCGEPACAAVWASAAARTADSLGMARREEIAIIALLARRPQGKVYAAISQRVSCTQARRQRRANLLERAGILDRRQVTRIAAFGQRLD